MLNVHLFRVVNPSNSQWLLFSMCSYNIYCLKPSVLDAKNAVLFKLQVYNPPSSPPPALFKREYEVFKAASEIPFYICITGFETFQTLGQCWCILLLSMVKIIINNKKEVNIVKRKRHRSQKTWEKVKRNRKWASLLSCLIAWIKISFSDWVGLEVIFSHPGSCSFYHPVS